MVHSAKCRQSVVLPCCSKPLLRRCRPPGKRPNCRCNRSRPDKENKGRRRAFLGQLQAITTWLRRTPSEFSSFPANSRPRSHQPILSTYTRKQIAVLNEQDQGADGAGAEDGRGKCRVGHAKRQPGFQESLLITPSVQAAHLSPPPTRGASSCARKSRLPPIRRPRTLSIFLEPADFSVVRADYGHTGTVRR